VLIVEQKTVKEYCVGAAIYIFVSGLCAYGPQIKSGWFAVAALIQAALLVIWLLQIRFKINNPIEAGVVSCILTLLLSLIYSEVRRIYG
jgi:hypothetical protein